MLFCLFSFLLVEILNARGLVILDSTCTVSWSLSIAPHTSLHTSRELPVPEHDVVLPEAGVVPFFRDFNSENACIDGSVNLLHVLEVLNVRGFGILDGTFIVS